MNKQGKTPNNAFAADAKSRAAEKQRYARNETDMKDTEHIVLIGKINDRQILSSYVDAVQVLEWLGNNGHGIESWELYVLENGKYTRTSDFDDEGNVVRGEHSTIEDISEQLGVLSKKWVDDKRKLLVVQFNLKNDYVRVAKKSSTLIRVFCGILGLPTIFLVIGLGVFGGVESDLLLYLLMALLGGVLFLYVAITGHRHFYFLLDIANMRWLVRKKMITESGKPRWA